MSPANSPRLKWKIGFMIMEMLIFDTRLSSVECETENIISHSDSSIEVVSCDESMEKRGSFLFTKSFSVMKK